MRRDEFEIIRRCMSGDRDAFQYFVETYQKPVMDTIYRMVGNMETAKDLAQETFVKVYTKLHTFDPRYPFRVWIQRIAMNCTIDFLRRRKPEYLVLDKYPDSGGESPANRIPSKDTPPDLALEKNDHASIVQEAVNRLDTGLRAVIVMRHFREMKYEEIAMALKIPLGTVKNRLFRARGKLEAMLLKDPVLKEELCS